MPENNVPDPITEQATVQQQLVEQDTGELPRFNVGRDQVLRRLWEIANMDPERTRSSMSAQVKAISMIVAIEGLIPDRRAVAAQSKSVPPPVHPGFYKAAWLRQLEGENAEPQPPPAPDQAQAQEEGTAPELQSAPGGDDNPPPTPNPTPDPGESIFPGLNLSQTASSPYPSRSSWVPDSREPVSIPRHPFGRRR
jgi:hypothetical protein